MRSMMTRIITEHREMSFEWPSSFSAKKTVLGTEKTVIRRYSFVAVDEIKRPNKRAAEGNTWCLHCSNRKN